MGINSACDEKIATHLLNMVQPNFVDGGLEAECQDFVECLATTDFGARILMKYLQIGMFAAARRVRIQYIKLFEKVRGQSANWWLWTARDPVSEKDTT